MALFSGLKDIAITADGDLAFAEGDLKTVSGIEWFIQEVNKILRSGTDWYFAPNAGANLESFYGSPNTRELGKRIEERIYDKITQQQIHVPGNLKVRVVPISKDAIDVFIDLDFANQTIGVSRLIFNLQSGFLRPVEIEQEQVARPVKNPYLKRIV
jgi:hypothetical protein